MEEPIDLAQYAAEKGNPWFGLGNLLTENTTQWASGTLTLTDIEAVFERMFESELQAEREHHLYDLKQRGVLPLSDIQALQGQLFTMARAEPAFLVHPKRMHWLRCMHAQGQRYARWHKIRKRQRRAAQRRHARGEQ